MLVNPRPITLDSARDVNTHLDLWATHALRDPDQWQRALAATRDWADYSARNQLLLASYAATGPVAGIETWRLVPSHDAGTCSVRSGEHALPVRVPVTTTGTEPDPHLGGARPTRAAVAGWEWRGVFCVDQLARRPDPAIVSPNRLPTGIADDALQKAAIAVARRTIKGAPGNPENLAAVLQGAAERMPRSAKRPAPTGTLAEQTSWLVLDRLRHTDTPLPRFDPGGMAVRERWESMLDVLDTDRRITAALGRHLDVDLLTSPLPRMEIDDDRAVPAARRNRLPRASVEQLPVGQWIDVGPYTADEWAARGEDANGKGTYLRLNSTAYLVVVKQGERATWRLEDTRAKVGAGRLDGGEDLSLDAARRSAMATLAIRYPQLHEHVPEPAPARSVRAEHRWEPVEGHPGARQHNHHGRVTSLVIPAGDQWVPFLQRSPDRLPEAVGAPTNTMEDAMATADAAGRRALREATITRVDFDTAVAQLAASPTYGRNQLIEQIGPRLASPERDLLAENPTPAQFAEILGAAGVTADTTVAVLHAEGLPADQVGPLLPILGIPPAEAIGELHRRWGIARTTAAGLVDASATEMRSAGCAPEEILAARPRDVLTALPATPALWDLAGGTLAAQGHTSESIAGFLATHSPDPDCFAAGLAAATDNPDHGIDLAVRRGMPPEAVAALSERYGLSPYATATALTHSGATPTLAVAVVHERCDHDPVLTTQIARSTLGLRTDTVLTALTQREPVDTATVHELHSATPLSRDNRAPLAAHRPPSRPPDRPVLRPEARRLLAELPPPDTTAPNATDGVRGPALAGPNGPDGERSLLAALPDPEPALELTEIDR